MPELENACEGQPLAPRTKQAFNTLRVVFAATDVRVGPPSVESFLQPGIYTDLINANAPERGECAIANVTLHNWACTRYDRTAALAIPETFPAPSRKPADVPWVNEPNPAPSPLVCDSLTLNGGSGAPQYRVRFRDGTNQTQEVWTDGNTVLSLPASNVDVELITPRLANIAEVQAGNLKVPEGLLVGPGLVVDAMASASIEWGSRNAVPAGPGGMLTWSQSQFVHADADGVPIPLYFQRPPFARRVRIGIALPLTPGTVVADFVGGVGLVLETIATGIPIPKDIPAHATQVRVVAAAFPNVPVVISCVWELGVR